jgi:hypothetical protein
MSTKSQLTNFGHIMCARSKRAYFIASQIVLEKFSGNLKMKEKQWEIHVSRPPVATPSRPFTDSLPPLSVVGPRTLLAWESLPVPSLPESRLLRPGASNCAGAGGSRRGASSVPSGSGCGRRRRRRCFGRIAAAGAAAPAAVIRAAWAPSAKCASSSSVIQVRLLQLVLES